MIGNDEWCRLFVDASVYHLPYLKSYHRPLYLSPCHFGQIALPRPFWFLASWTSHPEFNKFIRDNWSYDNDITGSLSLLTTKFKKWNFEVFGYIIKRKCFIAYRLTNVQVALDCRCS